MNLNEIALELVKSQSDTLAKMLPHDSPEHFAESLARVYTTVNKVLYGKN